MDILKNDVTAILGQIFDTKLQENKRHSTMTPGLDEKNRTLIFTCCLTSVGLKSKNCSSKKQKSFLLEHQESDFREKNLQFTLVL